MKRLIEKGLMFGNLMHVDTPVLVERYNRALRHLTGKSTALAEFHIDISGYSPEIGDELADHYYLNHGGVNRQFILLSTEQRHCPLLNAEFSTSRDILRRFIDTNERQLFALTGTDAVAGELENSVLEVSSPEQLFDTRRIVVEADTTGGTIAHSARLESLIERFLSEQDAWFDGALIAEMVETAKLTGDISRNPVRLQHAEFEQKNFWTSHFGGLYLFTDVQHSALIASGEKPRGRLPVDRVLSFEDRKGIARFLEDNQLAEPIVKARGANEVVILRQKMDFILAATLAHRGVALDHLSRSDMRRLAPRHTEHLPKEYEGLAAMARWAETRGARPRIGMEHPSYFYLLRATNTPDRDLVNMLLAELSPLDFRQLFICHKHEFYRRYRSWSESKRAYVTNMLSREYAMDKAGARALLFGDGPDMHGAIEEPKAEARDAISGPNAGGETLLA
ncbi:MAG: hypothetical protein LPK20_12135 [Halomonas sp.]|jgi:hypothetical protein|uniref:Uncharacterized protein n=1 Tax=Billgrantia tianxiuensis TaxID=2497861 RepID=A0A6I6SKA4_9GAMM|nr:MULTISPECIES: DUF6638 family protein [Halomonas]MCE8034081.1 hypothetical protein [Halomonas sp. MCCC 1A11057]MDX5434309.1 hypothetical protein [Halomonas sp.]QHC51069.1 hypothetical protein EKK97_17845 [Halomonas tianxiuensis]